MRVGKSSPATVVSAAVLLSAACVLAAPEAKGGLTPRQAQAARPSLTGRVVDANGRGVRGARVSIYEAGVKQGDSPFCPSCYPDCAKSAIADAQGRFRIASLDPQLRFRLLVIAGSYEPTFTDHVDPAAGLIKIALKPRRMGLSDPAHVVRGQILGPDDVPVPGAMVEPYGMITPQGEEFSDASFLGVDPLAISDKQGRFAFYTKKPDVTFLATIKARGLATQVTNKLSTGIGPHILRLGAGASVYGRIVRAEKPVPGVPVGLVQVDKNSETFVGPLKIATDSQGHFLLTNVTPNMDCLVYGLMEGTGQTAATVARRIHVGADGTADNTGDMVVSPLHRLTGRIVLTNSQMVPPMTRILISRQGAWDAKTVAADAQGRFTADALPDETLDVSVGGRDYQFADGNTGLDPLADNPQNGSYYRRTLHVLPTITSITLRMEPSRAIHH